MSKKLTTQEIIDRVKALGGYKPHISDAELMIQTMWVDLIRNSSVEDAIIRYKGEEETDDELKGMYVQLNRYIEFDAASFDMFFRSVGIDYVRIYGHMLDDLYPLFIVKNNTPHQIKINSVFKNGGSKWFMPSDSMEESGVITSWASMNGILSTTMHTGVLNAWGQAVPYMIALWYMHMALAKAYNLKPGPISILTNKLVLRKYDAENYVVKAIPLFRDLVKVHTTVDKIMWANSLLEDDPNKYNMSPEEFEEMKASAAEDLTALDKSMDIEEEVFDVYIKEYTANIECYLEGDVVPRIGATPGISEKVKAMPNAPQIGFKFKP